MRHGWVVRMVAAGVMVMAVAGGASAQAAGERGYVGGVVFADFSRYSGPDGDVRIALGESPSGTVPGGAVRGGIAMGERWGVEGEVALSGTVRWQPIYPYVLAASTGPTSSVYTGDSERRLTTVSALAWARKPLSERVSLVVLGGVAFTRTAQSRVYAYPLALPLELQSLVAPSEFTYFDIGPAVGVDVPVRLTDRLDAMAGVRLQGVGGTAGAGWLVRPSAGLRWRF